MISNEDFETTCQDGVVLRGTLLIPDVPKAVIQFNCGTGTKREVYLSFLNYLAEQGFVCCLWEYRGSGRSSPGDMQGCTFTFSDYGIKDMPAIKSYLNHRFPHLPYLIVGHSAGGQQVGFMHNLEDVKGMVNIAVSAGYYANMPFAYRMRAYFYFYLFAPLSAAINGYVKGETLGLMENLPTNVVYQWRSWLTKPSYFFDKEFYGISVPIGNFSKLNFPIHVYWTVDDAISNQKNTEAFWKHIKSTKDIAFTKLVPAEVGVKNIDHFGFFRRNMKDKLWVDIAKTLNGMVEA